MFVLLCYPVSIYMLQLLSTGRPISSLFICFIILSYRNITCISCCIFNSLYFNSFQCGIIVQPHPVLTIRTYHFIFTVLVVFNMGLLYHLTLACGYDTCINSFTFTVF